MEKVETLEREYRKVSKVVEFMMPLIETMDEYFKRRFFEKRKERLSDTSELQVRKAFVKE